MRGQSDNKLTVPPSPAWICPLCSGLLQEHERQLKCARGHCFDKAKAGYVNLLPSHRKRSADPGDDRHMLISRRDFLARGYYSPLADHLAHCCAELAVASQHPFAILDTGCGEGYYTAAVAAAIDAAVAPAPYWCGGIDISKHAVRLAARRSRAVHFAVASNAAIPLPDRSLDCILRVFAPGYSTEVVRVLRPGGRLIVVTPGARHLYGLRRLVYDRVEAHALAPTDVEGLLHLQRAAVDFTMRVEGHEDVARLLAMTPYFWQASAEKQRHIAGLEQLDTEVSFVIDLFQLPYSYS